MDLTIERLKKRIKSQTPHPTRDACFIIEPTVMVMSKRDAKKDVEALELHKVNGYCEITSNVHLVGKRFWRPVHFFQFAE